jgi:hypothetical protein
VRNLYIFPFVLLIWNHSWSQKTYNIVDFKDQHVLYTDIGINPAPFNLYYPFTSEIRSLKYKNNFKPILGLAYAYKWFSLRLAFPVMPGFRNEARFGRTQQFSLGFDYNFKRLYTDFDFRINTGYAIKNALKYDSAFTEANPNDIMPNLGSLNLSVNLWYFNHDDFKMNALQGKRAHFNGEVHTWYLKGTLNFFGITNDKNSIIPDALIDVNHSKTGSSAFSSLDFGVIPGYAYANRINRWQFSGWAGIGPVIQSKFFVLSDNLNGFLGLAPRYDIRFVGGYSSDQRFLLLAAHFDNKSIRYQSLRYDQYFYTLRLVAGIRIPPKKDTPATRRQRSRAT